MSILFAVLLGLLCMMLTSLADFFVAKAARQIDPIRGALWSILLGAACMLLAAIFFTSPNTVTRSEIVLLLASGILQTIAIVALFSALQRGKVGIVIPIASAYSALTVLVTVLFLGEIISGVQATSIAVIIGASLFLARAHEENKQIGVAGGVLFALIACMSWTAQYIILDILVDKLDWFIPIAASQVISAAVLVLYFLLTKRDLRFPKTIAGSIISIALLNAIAFLAYGFAISHAYTAFVLPIAQSTPLLSTILAWIFLREKLTKLQLLCVVFIVGGITALVI